MAGIWLRRSLLLAAGAAAMALAGCGSGSIESQLTPSRIIAFGDSFADLGQTGTRYTINDGTTNIWTQQVAASFGRTLATASAGGLSYATANARVNTTPDAVGNAATPTVEQQIGTFLAAGALQANDLVLVSGGMADVVAEGARVIAGTQTAGQAETNVRAAGKALGAQVRRLVQAGGQHVVVAGPYSLDKSPWAIQTGQGAMLANLSGKFNEELLVSIVDLGANVLYIDAALHFNVVVANPSGYSLGNVTEMACTSVDPGAGIGTGAGQVSSGLCSASTIGTGIDPSRYLWADRVYPTPQGHRVFGDYAYSRIRGRW